MGPQGPVLPWEPLWYDPSLLTFLRRYVFGTEPKGPSMVPTASLQMPLKDTDISGSGSFEGPNKLPDDSAHAAARV